MNDTNPSTPCTCTTCPGAAWSCACQTAAAQAAPQAACACGPQCQCGQVCNCAGS